MVYRVPWFSPADYEIFIFYEKHDIAITAKSLAANIDYSREYVNRRMRVLEDVGLLDNENGIYELTELGRRYLAGNVGRDEMPEP